MKLLNLDELPVRDEKVVVLGGKRHAMRPMSIGDFIRHQKVADEVDVAGNVGAQFEAIIDAILSVFPTIARADLEALTMDKVDALFRFIAATAEDEVKQGAAEGNG